MFSCNQNTKEEIQINKENYKRVYDDPIEDSLQPFWYTNQIADPKRLEIVEDPDSSENDLFKVFLEPGDKVAKGNRSEIVIKPQDSFGYRNNYSFKFKFTKSFFKKQNTHGYILLNQWHNVPYPGYNYRNQVVKVRVPFALMVEHHPDGSFKMVMHYGLRVNTLDEMVWAVWPGELKPDVWYTFENEIFWSLYSDGYSKPKLNNILFEVEGIETSTFVGANMYHVLPHDYKMGLYWNGKQKNNIHIFYDDFKMTTERIAYFPSISKKNSLKQKGLDFSGYSYVQITSKGKELFRQQLNNRTAKKLYGINESILYQVEENKFEILFPLISDTLGFQKVRLEHDVSPAEVKIYADQKVSFNKDSTKVIFWGTLGNRDVLHYKKKHAAVFSFKSPLKRINNLSFHAGDQRRVTVFRIDTLILNK